MITSFIVRLELRLMGWLQRRAATRKQLKEKQFTKKLEAFDAMGF